MNKILISLLFVISWLDTYSQPFERVPDVDLTGGYLGFSSWCDFNSDGYLDVIVSGMDFGADPDHAVLYRNNGNKTFSPIGFDQIPRVVYGAVAWGDYDNNGTPDLLYGGTVSGRSADNITKIYKNTGSDFIEIPHPVPNLAQCYYEWVDANNDGLLDIYYQGINSESSFDLGICKNTGNGDFEKADVNIEKIFGPRGNYTENSAKWADFDNDGLKDVIIAMSTSYDHNFEFYKNLGDFNFKKIDIGLPKLNYVRLAVGDLNMDGLFDIVFTGSTEYSLYSGDLGASLYIYFNNGNLNFNKDYKFDNTGVFWNTVDLGDINNDGYLDIIDYGTGGDFRRTLILLNNKDNTFSNYSHGLTNSSEGGASFGDFDNDNDLDILYYGRIYSSNETEVTYVYENKSPVTNNKPGPPDGIGIFAENNDLRIHWNNGSDDLTAPEGLSYNLKVYGSNSDTVLSCNSLNGKLKVPAWGNMGLNRQYLYENFPEGQFNIRLQSTDNSYNASAFSDPYNFCFKRSSHLLGDSLFICDGDSIVLGVHGNYTGFLWNTGSEDSVIYAKTEGSYNVNLTHPDGCISSETVYLKVFERPQLSLSDSVTACQGDTITLEVNDFESVLWSNGSEISIRIASPGKYWVTVKNKNNCADTDTIAALFNPLPSLYLGMDKEMTAHDTLILTPGGAHSSYLWNNGSINDTLIVIGEQNRLGGHVFWLKVTNEFGCMNSDTINVSNSPDFNWAAGNSGLLPDKIWGSEITDGNDIYICGRMHIGNDWDDHAILARYNSSGELIWQYKPASFSGESRDLAFDSEGNIIVAGNYYYDAMQLDTIQLPASNSPRVFIAKFDPDGNLLWARDYGSDVYGRTVYVNSIGLDDNDNIYFTGNFNENIVWDQFVLNRIRSVNYYEFDIFLASLDPAGEFRWAKSFGGLGDDWTYDMIIRNGKIFIAGGFSSRDAVFDSIHPEVQSSGQLDYVASFDLSGNIHWFKSSKPGSSDCFGEMVDLAADSKGNIYGYGHIYGKLIFDKNIINNYFQQYGTNVRGGMLVKYDSTGNTVWVKSINNALTHGYSDWVPGGIGRISGEIVCDKNDNLYLASSFIDSLELDFYTLHSKDSYQGLKARDAYLVKYNEIGFPQWFRQIGGDDDVFITTLANNGNGNIIFGGYHKSLTLKLDSTSLVNNSGRNEVSFIAKLLDTSSNICPDIEAGLAASRDYICKGDSLQVHGTGTYANTFHLYRNQNLYADSYYNEFNLIDSGNYHIVINQGLVCSDTTSTVYIGIRNKPESLIHYSPDSIICDEDIVQLFVQQNINNQYTWYKDQILQQTLNRNEIDVTTAGTYSVSVNDGYCQNSDSVRIISGMPVAAIETASDLVLCPDEHISLESEYYPDYNYEWYLDGIIAGNDTNVLNVNLPGKYSLKVNNLYCSETDSLEVTSEVSPFVDIQSDTVITESFPLQIIPSGDSLFNYSWYYNNDYLPVSRNFMINALQYGTYMVMAYNSCGYVLDDVHVMDAMVVGNSAPDNSAEINVFPNPSTGVFRIYAGDYKVKSISIYNSAGIWIRNQSVKTVGNVIDLDLSGEIEGIYYFVIKTTDLVVVRKVILY